MKMTEMDVLQALALLDPIQLDLIVQNIQSLMSSLIKKSEDLCGKWLFTQNMGSNKFGARY